jgi:hypothetical protein
VLEAEVAFLDQVEQIHSLREGVAACNGHDETQVGADEAILGLGRCGHLGLQVGAALAVGEQFSRFAALLDDARELALVLSCEEGNLSDVVEIETNRVIHYGCYNRSWWCSFRPRAV